MRDASAQLLLSPGAEATWAQVARPWLEAGRGRLERAYVVVPTRGQAHALKQRCLMEGVALLGVEFLTPGLARKKWAALDDAERPAIGRELLLLGLRSLIARRLEPLAPTDAAWGFWKSLQSDPERALDDFDEMLKGGFRAGDFPLAPLADIFRELERWVDVHGYEFAPLQAEEAGLAERAPGALKIAGRVLVYGVSAELWGEFFNMAAFVRRCANVTVVLPAPEFLGRAALDEKWVEWWERTLETDADMLAMDEAGEEGSGCAGVAALWGGEAAEPDAERAAVRVGRTRADEMELVAELVAARLAAGAENIGVVFPAADAAHQRLSRRLAECGVAFVDLLGPAGTPPVDVQTQRAVLAFHEKGGRLEELLALWPLARAIGAATLPLAEARRACERAFDDTQSHAVEKALPLWRESSHAAPVAELAEKLLPVWPEELTLADALRRFREVCVALELESPALNALEVFALRSREPYPRAVVLATLASFLPETNPVLGAPGRGGFARVTLTTRRRAEGVGWSHLIFVESNAGVWPERREPSCWLTDEHRERLNERGRFGLGLFTTEHRAGLERAGLAALARDTTEEVIFTAALHDDEEPELKLAPNAWLERVLWARGEGGAEADLEKAFERMARSAGAMADADAAAANVEQWFKVWVGRRDPKRVFDEFFFAGDPARITPTSLTARGMESGVRDPAELWFDAVLGARRVGWEPLARARRKALGQRAHELLAAALRPAQTDGRGWGEMPEKPEAAARLGELLARLRAAWPEDFYWDSFHAELAQVCGALLDNVYLLPDAGRHVATEAVLPAGATVPLGAGRFAVTGRMDFVRLDRAGWKGARVDVVDFKTGGDLALSAARMARDGASLQLGVYLVAALSLGAAGGKVWMVKPGQDEMAALGAEELDEALALLGRLERSVTTGVYGALTRDRSEYAPSGFAWPLACTPISEAILKAKFAGTFGADEPANDEEGTGDA